MAADEQNPEGHEGFLQRFDDIPLHQYLGLTLAEVKSDYGRLRLLKTPTTQLSLLKIHHRVQELLHFILPKLLCLF